MTLDLAIRGGTVVAAAHTMACDLGVRDGRIVALCGEAWPAAQDIDAARPLLLPGGIDGRVHLDQRQGEVVRMADGSRSGTTGAAAVAGPGHGASLPRGASGRRSAAIVSARSRACGSFPLDPTPPSVRRSRDINPAGQRKGRRVHEPDGRRNLASGDSTRR